MQGTDQELPSGVYGRSGAVVLTSHELAELALCTQMHVLRQGRLTKIENGLSANELISQFR